MRLFIQIMWLTSHIDVDMQLKILSFPPKYQFESERLFCLFEDVEERPIRTALQLINLAVWQSPKKGHTRNLFNHGMVTNVALKGQTIPATKAEPHVFCPN